MAAAEPAPVGPRSASAALDAAGQPAPPRGSSRAKPLEEQLREAGLEPLGSCQSLSAYGADLLQTSAMLQDMTPAEADILGQSMLFIRAEPGQVLIREGEAGDWMMILLKGTVDVSKQVEPAPDGLAGADAPAAEPTTSRIAVIQRGAAFGDMSMLDSEPRYASCTAIEAVEAGVLGRHAVALLIRDHPAVGAKVLVKITQLMAQRLRNTSNQLVKLLRQNATNAAQAAARH
ncbi:MAG: Crp/Fnr family transcriptional regulator [Polaromonas sp.]|nr:Crp/Fnr family transcriptional regulator [Polaromonas sp.]